MNRIAIIVAVVFLGTVTAQIPTATRDTSSTDWQKVDSVATYSCTFRAAERLHAATDPAQAANQEWNLNAATAYERLGAMGEKCE